jgi:hypothetical protein
MNWNHAAFAVNPRRFGRRTAYLMPDAPSAPVTGLSEDLRLFATTFAAGFLFVSLVIA